MHSNDDILGMEDINQVPFFILFSMRKTINVSHSEGVFNVAAQLINLS